MRLTWIWIIYVISPLRIHWICGIFVKFLISNSNRLKFRCAFCYRKPHFPQTNLKKNNNLNLRLFYLWIRNGEFLVNFTMLHICFSLYDVCDASISNATHWKNGDHSDLSEAMACGISKNCSTRNQHKKKSQEIIIADKSRRKNEMESRRHYNSVFREWMLWEKLFLYFRFAIFGWCFEWCWWFCQVFCNLFKSFVLVAPK